MQKRDAPFEKFKEVLLDKMSETLPIEVDDSHDEICD